MNSEAALHHPSAAAAGQTRTNESTPGFWRRWYAYLVCGVTLFLILLGGLVTSHDAGLAVPDWPNTFGYNMFLFPPSMWVGGIFWEHTHRLVASLVGVLTIGLAAWLWWSDSRRWVRVLSYTAVAAVTLQGVLGGITVLFLLPTPISVSHAVLGQSFFLMTLMLAYSQSPEWHGRAKQDVAAQRPPVSVARWSLALLALVFAQLIAGAAMRHTGSGLAMPDFPTMGGQWIPLFNDAMLNWINHWRMEYSFSTGAHLPDVTMGQVVLHFAHRVGALAVTVAAIGAVVALRRSGAYPAGLRTAWIVLGLVALQWVFGVWTIWSVRDPLITSFHVVIGAATLGASMLLCLRVLPVRWRSTVEVLKANDGESHAPQRV